MLEFLESSDVATEEEPLVLIEHHQAFVVSQQRSGHQRLNVGETTSQELHLRNQWCTKAARARNAPIEDLTIQVDVRRDNHRPVLPLDAQLANRGGDVVHHGLNILARAGDNDSIVGPQNVIDETKRRQLDDIPPHQPIVDVHVQHVTHEIIRGLG